jgi:HAD superfamily hydrolase (TIGR01509 family)
LTTNTWQAPLISQPGKQVLQCPNSRKGNLCKHLDWLKHFDHQTYSCDIGINKPNIRIYEHCLNRLAVSPRECLFVEDCAKECGRGEEG